MHDFVGRWNWTKIRYFFFSFLFFQWPNIWYSEQRNMIHFIRDYIVSSFWSATSPLLSFTHKNVFLIHSPRFPGFKFLTTISMKLNVCFPISQRYCNYIRQLSNYHSKLSLQDSLNASSVLKPYIQTEKCPPVLMVLVIKRPLLRRFKKC